MIKRNIAFTVDAAGTVTPGIPQYGGVKGEHKATVLVITLAAGVYSDGEMLRLRFTSGDGAVLSSDLMEDVTVAEDGTATLSYALPRLLTVPAGQLCVRVDVTSLDENGDEVQSFCSEEAVLYFDEAAVENGTLFWTGVSEMLARTVTAKKQAVDAGASAAENASAAAEDAQTASTAAIRAVNARVSAETYAADAKAAKADAVAAATNAGESRKGAAAQAASAQAAATAAEEAQVAAENAAGKAAVGQQGCEYLAGVATTAAEEAQAAQKAAEEALAAIGETMSYKGDISGAGMSMTTGNIGDVYHCTTDNRYYLWNGSKWICFTTVAAIDKKAIVSEVLAALPDGNEVAY